jgi:DsbC/DsbD-like thiol-disulfide interchange protein
MMKIILLSFFLSISAFAFSQNQLTPVSWSVSYVDLPNNEGEIIFTAKIDPKWHIYSQRPTDAGPIPTSFSITPNANFELIGKVVETDAHEEFVAAFDAKVFVFEKEAVFKQKIKRKVKAGFTIPATVEYMTCNDRQCLPPKTVDVTLMLAGKK